MIQPETPSLEGWAVTVDEATLVRQAAETAMRAKASSSQTTPEEALDMSIIPD